MKLINPKTRSHRIRLHRIMWRWLGEDGSRRKKDWPGWEKYEKQYANCFLCYYRCTECPLIWPGERTLCMHGGLFDQWGNISISEEERAKLAKEIAELPVRPLG